MHRYAVTRTTTGTTLRARKADGHTVARVGSFLLLLLATAPAAYAWVAPDSEAISAIVLLLLGTVAAVVTQVYVARTRLLEQGAFSRVRRVLEIQRGADGDHRHAPRGPRIIVDGRVLDATDTPKVAVSISTSVMSYFGAQSTRTRCHVRLIFRTRVVLVDTVSRVDDAKRLARVLLEALGLGAHDLAIGAEVPFDTTGAGLLIIVPAVLANSCLVVFAVVWAALADVGESAGLRLALAGVVTAVLVFLAQEIAFRFSLRAFTARAQSTFELDLAALPSRRPAWIGTAAWAALAITLGYMAIASMQDSYEPSFNFDGDFIPMANIDGTSSPVGQHWRSLVALDPKSGKPRWSLLPVESSMSHILLGGPVSLVYGSWGYPDSTARAIAFELRTGKARWTATMLGNVDAAFFYGECLVLHLDEGDFLGSSTYKALDPTTGETCRAHIDLPRLDWEHQDPKSKKMDPNELRRLEERYVGLQAAEKEQAPRRRDGSIKHASIHASGTTYELDASGGQLVLSATRSDRPIWTTKLPAAAIDGLPFAVYDTTVLVAGVARYAPPTRRHLRLVGVDAATGNIRFVNHHPAEGIGPTDVTFSSGVALVYWANELCGYDPTTGKLLWSTSARR